MSKYVCSFAFCARKAAGHQSANAHAIAGKHRTHLQCRKVAVSRFPNPILRPQGLSYRQSGKNPKTGVTNDLAKH
jgi:hypothetical protein